MSFLEDFLSTARDDAERTAVQLGFQLSSQITSANVQGCTTPLEDLERTLFDVDVDKLSEAWGWYVLLSNIPYRSLRGEHQPLVGDDVSSSIAECIHKHYICACCGAIDARTNGRRTLPRLSKCGRCKSISFCNATCQSKFWPSHKRECKQLKLARKKTAAFQVQHIAPNIDMEFKTRSIFNNKYSFNAPSGGSIGWFEEKEFEKLGLQCMAGGTYMVISRFLETGKKLANLNPQLYIIDVCSSVRRLEGKNRKKNTGTSAAYNEIDVLEIVTTAGTHSSLTEIAGAKALEMYCQNAVHIGQTVHNNRDGRCFVVKDKARKWNTKKTKKNKKQEQDDASEQTAPYEMWYMKYQYLLMPLDDETPGGRVDACAAFVRCSKTEGCVVVMKNTQRLPDLTRNVFMQHIAGSLQLLSDKSATKNSSGHKTKKKSSQKARKKSQKVRASNSLPEDDAPIIIPQSLSGTFEWIALVSLHMTRYMAVPKHGAPGVSMQDRAAQAVIQKCTTNASTFSKSGICSVVTCSEADAPEIAVVRQSYQELSWIFGRDEYQMWTFPMDFGIVRALYGGLLYHWNGGSTTRRRMFPVVKRQIEKYKDLGNNMYREKRYNSANFFYVLGQHLATKMSTLWNEYHECIPLPGVIQKKMKSKWGPALGKENQSLRELKAKLLFNQCQVLYSVANKVLAKGTIDSASMKGTSLEVMNQKQRYYVLMVSALSRCASAQTEWPEYEKAKKQRILLQKKVDNMIARMPVAEAKRLKEIRDSRQQKYPSLTGSAVQNDVKKRMDAEMSNPHLFDQSFGRLTNRYWDFVFEGKGL